MSLASALNSAVSGLAAQSAALQTISTNIANASTTGYKVEDTDFESLVAGSASSSTSGQGVSTTGYRDMSAQGQISSTTTATNMAINGTGFFVVSGGTADTSAATDLYTRDGDFSTDADGYLVNDSGEYLMGYATDASGDVTSAAAGSLSGLSPIQIPETTSVTPTTEATLAANLPADAATGASVTSQMQVVDSQGTTQTIGETWTKTADDAWTLTLSNPYSTDASTSTGTISPSTIDVTFDSNGVLTSPTSTTALSLTLSSGATSSFSLNLGTAGETDGLTQYASSDGSAKISITSNTQNGSTAGSLASVAVGTDGIVSATYSNGETIDVAKVPVATFADQEGLTALSGSTFAASTTSGSATLSTAGTGSAGTITGSALEASGTDTATEFDQMIVAQQAYSAAAQVVTYVDKMFSDLTQAIG